MFLYFPFTLPKILNFLHAYISIYIHRVILTVPLKMTEVWSKRHVLPFVFIVKRYNIVEGNYLSLPA